MSGFKFHSTSQSRERKVCHQRLNVGRKPRRKDARVFESSFAAAEDPCCEVRPVFRFPCTLEILGCERKLSFRLSDTCVEDGPTTASRRGARGGRVAGPSICYSMPCCFLSCSKFSLRASRSSFDRTIFSGWWYSTVPCIR